MLKKLLLAGVVALVLLVLAGFLVSPKVHVERTLTMKASPGKIFEQINTLKNWEKWSPWHKLDPEMKLQYSGPESGVGAKYAWQSQKHGVGNGSLTISKSVSEQEVETVMVFDKGGGVGDFKLEKAGEGTKVVWSMDADMGKNPLARYMGLAMDKMVGPDFQKGLENLRQLSEAK